MKDKYKELSDILNILVNLIKEFEVTKDDYKKPDIRAYQVKMLNLGKIINGKVLEDIQKLNDFVDNYLSDPKKKKYSVLVDKAIVLNNDLWEL